jgi:hypothetical protein
MNRIHALEVLAFPPIYAMEWNAALAQSPSRPAPAAPGGQRGYSLSVDVPHRVLTMTRTHAYTVKRSLPRRSSSAARSPLRRRRKNYWRCSTSARRKICRLKREDSDNLRAR